MAKEPEDRRGAGSPDKHRPVTLDLKAEEVKKAEEAKKTGAAGEKPAGSHVSEEPLKKGAANAPQGSVAPGGETTPADNRPADNRPADKSPGDTARQDRAQQDRARQDRARQEDALKKGSASRGGDTAAQATSASSAGASSAGASATGPKAGTAPTASAAQLDRKAEGARPGAAGPAGPADRSTGGSAGKPAGQSSEQSAGKSGNRPDGERPIAASSENTPPSHSEPQKRGPGFLPLFGAGLLGAVVALGGAYGLGLVGPGGVPDQVAGQVGGQVGGQEARLASLERQLEAQTGALSTAENELRQRLDALENQVSGGGSSDLRQEIDRLEASIATLSQGGDAGAASSAALEEVRARLGELESAVASGTAPGGDVDARLQTLSQEVEALRTAPAGASAATQDALSTISGRLEDVAGRVSAMEGAEPVDLQPLQERIAATENAVSQLQGEVAAAATSDDLGALRASLEEMRDRIDEIAAASGRAAALAPGVAGQALTAALESGRPYEAELRTASSFGIEAPETLAAFAESGLPSRAALVAEFRDIAPKLTEEANAPMPGAGLMDRLKASALNLVEVRPAGPRAGEGAVAVTSRIEAALRSGAFERALAEWKSLPDAARAASADWGAKLEARVAGEELAARLRAESLTRLDAAG